MYTRKAQVCFWIVVYATENVTKILFWFAIEKHYKGYPQANECPCSVSAARGKLLPMDTAANFTKLMNYSGLQKQNIIRVKSQANECPSVSAAQSKLLPKDTTENVTTMIYSGLQKKKNY